MKVFFDARMIDHPGIGRYISCLLERIARRPEVELVVLGRRAQLKQYFPSTVQTFEFNAPIYSVAEQIAFLRLKGVVKEAILHVPHYNIPLGGSFKLVVTIHDLLHIFYPQGARSRFAPGYMKFMVGKCLKRASRIICVSRFTREALEHVYRLGKAPFPVIYEGVDAVFTKRHDISFLGKLQETYSLPQKFILYVGSIRRHKNIATLLTAFSQLRKKIPDCALVLVGRLSQSFNVDQPGVCYLGEIPDNNELAGLYQLATVFCNLSLQEGFGLTILEAQQSQVPIVCSNISAHMEVGGEGVIAVEPLDVDAVVGALYNVLSDHAAGGRCLRLGLSNVQRFSWERTADQTIGVYKEVSK